MAKADAADDDAENADGKLATASSKAAGKEKPRKSKAKAKAKTKGAVDDKSKAKGAVDDKASRTAKKKVANTSKAADEATANADDGDKAVSAMSTQPETQVDCQNPCTIQSSQPMRNKFGVQFADAK